MHLLDSSLVPCKNLECETFETIHRLKFYFKSNKECDSEISKKIDGVIIVEKLIHALVNDGLGRGIHRGEFEWLVPGSGFPFRAIGEMAGITNAGKYRNPLNECETCDTKGRM